MPELNTPKESPQIIEGLDPLMAKGTMYDGEDVQGSSTRRTDGMDVVETEDDVATAAEPVAKPKRSSKKKQ